MFVKNILKILVNYIPMILWCVFYSQGANVALGMVPLLLVIVVMNYIFSKHIYDLLFYNGNLLISTVLGIYINSELYFKFIYYDSEGALVRNVEIMIGFIYIALLTAIALLFRIYKLRKNNK